MAQIDTPSVDLWQIAVVILWDLVADKPQTTSVEFNDLLALFRETCERANLNQMMVYSTVATALCELPGFERRFRQVFMLPPKHLSGLSFSKLRLQAAAHTA
jgi:hypothetical protein